MRHNTGLAGSSEFGYADVFRQGEGHERKELEARLELYH